MKGNSNENIRIPFNRPSVVGREFEYMQSSIDKGQISGDGMYSKLCQQLLQESLGVTKVLLTTSCTSALEMSALLLDIQPGDEVIVPSFTFVSSINAFVLRGARPVFVDIRPDTLNLNEALLETAITPQTKAIIVTHYAGVACEMDAISEIAKKHGIAIVEDNAHGLFGKYRDRYLGTLGAMATLSFHETKNFTCGEGGALLINDPQYSDRAEIIREKGTNRSRFFRGQIDKYTWIDVGSSYLPSDILAGFLFAQLEEREQIQNARGRIWECYHERLASWANQFGVRLPVVPPHCEQPYHIYYLLLPSLEVRQALIDHLKREGILSVFHYLPLHLSDMGRHFGGAIGDCPVTEDISDRLLRLPLYASLNEADQFTVIAALQSFDRW